MLKSEENERITRVGPGTPAGELFRRYWLPVLLSEELTENDGAPKRIRVLCEDLIAFRDTNGKVGLVDAFCPHRRAPMFFGRNEECGLRCVYHGWKFDVSGACVDMPSEPPDSLFKNKVTIKAYPTWEGGDVIWAYMGPPETMPPPPDYEWVRAPKSHRFVSKTFEDCNYLQGLEGGLDTAHSSFAHNEKIGDTNWIRNADTAPRLDVDKTEYGFRYTSTRTLDDGDKYIRVYHYVMPAIQLRGDVTSWIGRSRSEVPKLDGHFWLPIDDTHTWVLNFMYGYDKNIPITQEFAWAFESRFGRGKDDLIPGTYMLKANKENDFFIDRERQRTQTFTGIKGINTQDYALQIGMGPICDRTGEHLGTSDKAIIATRQLLFEGMEVVAKGERPRGAHPEQHRNIRAYDSIVKKDEDWQVVFAEPLRPKF